MFKQSPKLVDLCCSYVAYMIYVAQGLLSVEKPLYKSLLRAWRPGCHHMILESPCISEELVHATVHQKRLKKRLKKLSASQRIMASWKKSFVMPADLVQCVTLLATCC